MMGDCTRYGTFASFIREGLESIDRSIMKFVQLDLEFDSNLILENYNNCFRRLQEIRKNVSDLYENSRKGSCGYQGSKIGILESDEILKNGIQLFKGASDIVQEMKKYSGSSKNVNSEFVRSIPDDFIPLEFGRIANQSNLEFFEKPKISDEEELYKLLTTKEYELFKKFENLSNLIQFLLDLDTPSFEKFVNSTSLDPDGLLKYISEKTGTTFVFYNATKPDIPYEDAMHSYLINLVTGSNAYERIHQRVMRTKYGLSKKIVNLPSETVNAGTTGNAIMKQNLDTMGVTDEKFQSLSEKTDLDPLRGKTDTLHTHSPGNTKHIFGSSDPIVLIGDPMGPKYLPIWYKSDDCMYLMRNKGMVIHSSPATLSNYQDIHGYFPDGPKPEIKNLEIPELDELLHFKKHFAKIFTKNNFRIQEPFIKKENYKKIAEDSFPHKNVQHVYVSPFPIYFKEKISTQELLNGLNFYANNAIIADMPEIVENLQRKFIA